MDAPLTNACNVDTTSTVSDHVHETATKKMDAYLQMCEELGLGGLAAAVDALEENERAAGRGGGGRERARPGQRRCRDDRRCQRAAAAACARPRPLPRGRPRGRFTTILPSLSNSFPSASRGTTWNVKRGIKC